MEKQRERLIELMNKQSIELLKDGDWDFVEMLGGVADYLIKNGVIVLPCKAGDTVYSIADCGTEPVELKVYDIIMYRDKTIISLETRHHQYRMASPEAFGKTIFNTDTEAIKVMKGGETV